MVEFNGNAAITVVITDCSMISLSLLVSTSAEINGPTHTHFWPFALTFVPVQASACPLNKLDGGINLE